MQALKSSSIDGTRYAMIDGYKLVEFPKFRSVPALYLVCKGWGSDVRGSFATQAEAEVFIGAQA